VSFARALAINPGYATGLQWYAELLEDMARYDEALAMIRRAQEADPFSLIINAVHGQILSPERPDEGSSREVPEKRSTWSAIFPSATFFFGLALVRDGKK